ncbi:aspartyl-phosphate phosphatase Spo0E family protein [uncultured Clostridium sp.]|nr:aspartyl-phosphate phosphatase Spo0E family protein [uncultured Clostridium sp.]
MEIYDEIDKIREILEDEIDKSSSLSGNKILELSVRLDKLINEYYRSIN